MNIKDKMKNAKESHLFDELSQEEKIEAIVNGKLKCRMIEELEKIRAEMEKDKIILFYAPQKVEILNEWIEKLDKRIAELKGENNE